MISSRQMAQAIAPLVETLFPTPRIPIPRVLNGERWIVFEVISPDNKPSTAVPKRQHKRNTLIGRPSPDPKNSSLPEISIETENKGVKPLRLAPSRRLLPRPPLPSAPLRASSSDELVVDLEIPLPADLTGQPKSAGRGKRSFLRPFMLKGKGKPPVDDQQHNVQDDDEITRPGLQFHHRAGIAAPAPAHTRNEVGEDVSYSKESPQELAQDRTHLPMPVRDPHQPMVEVRPIREKVVFRSDTVSNILDDYLDDNSQILESPYEETAFISGSIPKQHPLRDSTGPNPIERLTESISPVFDLESPIDETDTHDRDEVLQEAEHHVSTSILLSQTPVGESEIESPQTPVTIETPQAENESEPVPVSSPSPKTPERHHKDKDDSRHRTERSKRRSHRSKEGVDLESGKELKKERRRDKLIDDERQKRKARQERDSSKQRHTSKREAKVEEQQWLEVVFDGLPFGPSGTTVSDIYSQRNTFEHRRYSDLMLTICCS